MSSLLALFLFLCFCVPPIPRTLSHRDTGPQGIGGIYAVPLFPAIGAAGAAHLLPHRRSATCTPLCAHIYVRAGAAAVAYAASTCGVLVSIRISRAARGGASRHGKAATAALCCCGYCFHASRCGRVRAAAAVGLIGPRVSVNVPSRAPSPPCTGLALVEALCNFASNNSLGALLSVLALVIPSCGYLGTQSRNRPMMQLVRLLPSCFCLLSCLVSFVCVRFPACLRPDALPQSAMMHFPLLPPVAMQYWIANSLCAACYVIGVIAVLAFVIPSVVRPPALCVCMCLGVGVCACLCVVLVYYVSVYVSVCCVCCRLSVCGLYCMFCVYFSPPPPLAL